MNTMARSGRAENMTGGKTPVRFAPARAQDTIAGSSFTSAFTDSNHMRITFVHVRLLGTDNKVLLQQKGLSMSKPG